MMHSFKIYGIWLQASKQANIHTHVCNAVPLVWGLLRLTPIILSDMAVSFSKTYKQKSNSQFVATETLICLHMQLVVTVLNTIGLTTETVHGKALANSTSPRKAANYLA